MGGSPGDPTNGSDPDPRYTLAQLWIRHWINVNRLKAEDGSRRNIWFMY